jgi:hypothetical protein
LESDASNGAYDLTTHLAWKVILTVFSDRIPIVFDSDGPRLNS